MNAPAFDGKFGRGDRVSRAGETAMPETKAVYRYKDPWMQAMFDACLRLAADPTSEFYLQQPGPHHGKPLRGAGHRAAFWDGFAGLAASGPNRSANVIPGTLSWAAFMAGREWRKRRPDAASAADALPATGRFYRTSVSATDTGSAA